MQLRILLLGLINFPKLNFGEKGNLDLIYAVNLSKYIHPKFTCLIFNLRSVPLFQF